jgi:hypothetical protein
MRHLTAILLAAFVVGGATAAVLASAGALAPGPAWSEAPALVPVQAKGVVLEKAVVQVEAPAGGPVRVTTTYTFANAQARDAKVRVALPLSWEGTIEWLGGPARIQGPAGPADVAITAGSAPPVDIPAASLEPVELPADGPLGGTASALAFDFAIESYAATELTVRQTIAWAPLATPRMFPKEKGFSVGFAGLDAWGAGREAVSVAVTGAPPILGPATWAEPRPWRYDSKGVQWTLAPGEDGTLTVPPRFTLVTLADWDQRTFAGPYSARFEVTPEDDYPWDHRFFHAQPVTVRDGQPVLLRRVVVELIRTLDDIEQVVLARNGKTFSDTFAQMRFQKESWYRADPGFSEDNIKPVERFNLDYARCSARAARTVQSAFDKMKAEEIPATGRSFKMLLEAFRRCDEQYWNPKPATTERPRLE